MEMTLPTPPQKVSTSASSSGTLDTASSSPLSFSSSMTHAVPVVPVVLSDLKGGSMFLSCFGPCVVASNDVSTDFVEVKLWRVPYRSLASSSTAYIYKMDEQLLSQYFLKPLHAVPGMTVSPKQHGQQGQQQGLLPSQDTAVDRNAPPPPRTLLSPPKPLTPTSLSSSTLPAQTPTSSRHPTTSSLPPRSSPTTK